MAVQTGGATLPSDDREAIVHVFTRFLELEASYGELRNSLTTVLYTEPAKRREGQFAFADGTTWNPGSGRGLYQYVGGAWSKL